MFKTRVVCVAGKSRIAIQTMEMLRERNLSDVRLIAIVNATEDGVDGWQPSFLKYIAGRDDVTVVKLADTYDIDGLLFLSTEFDRLLRPERFRPDARLVNVHFSLLPAYKGMYTSALPILHGAAETGVTLHRIDAGIDTGAIIDQQAFAISPTDTAKTLYARYLDTGVAVMRRNLDRLLAGSEQATPQPAQNSSYFSQNTINYRALAIDLKQTAEAVVRQVHAFNHRSYQLIRIAGMPIASARISPNRSSAKPGTVVAHEGDILTVATIDFDCECIVDRFDDLMVAVRAQDVDTIGAILDGNPLLLEETGKEGWSPLIVAAYNGLTRSARYLLERGASANAGNQKLTTPLMYAKDHWLASGDPEMMRLLLAYGADPGATDIVGKTVIDYLSSEQSVAFRTICADSVPH